jgi:hypothetical protein
LSKYICSKAFLGDKKCNGCKMLIPHEYEGKCDMLHYCHKMKCVTMCMKYGHDHSDWLNKWYDEI